MKGGKTLSVLRIGPYVDFWLHAIAAVAGLAYSAPTIAAIAAGFGGPFGVVALRSAWEWALPAA